MGRISKAAREMSREAARFITGGYPRFVRSHNPPELGQEVPVFMFHGVEAVRFRTQVEFLKRNGYETLDLDTFMAFLAGETRLPGPSVLLTFDDGDRSWYDVAFPILQEFGYSGVGFIVPHFIAEDSSSAWLSWGEIETMEQSGVMRFESHSHRHSRIFVGPELIDFYHPGFTHNPLALEIPWVETNQGPSNNLACGTPIYRNASRCAGLPRFLAPESVKEACVRHVQSNGGPDYFRRAGWRRHLWRVANKSAHDRLAAFESAETTRSALLEDFTLARTTLQDRLGRPVEHLCYPWGVGSALAVEISREAGYSSNFWITHPDANLARSHLSPFAIPRIKDDYLLRLPGTGREPLARIFASKLQRRSTRKFIY